MRAKCEHMMLLLLLLLLLLLMLLLLLLLLLLLVLLLLLPPLLRLLLLLLLPMLQHVRTPCFPCLARLQRSLWQLSPGELPTNRLCPRPNGPL